MQSDVSEVHLWAVDVSFVRIREVRKAEKGDVIQFQSVSKWR